MPVSKPTEYLDWNDSLSNVIDPPSGLKTTGYVSPQVPAAQHFNWIVNLIDQWIQWLDQETSFAPITISSSQVLPTTTTSVRCDTSGGSFAPTLPLASSVPNGFRQTIKNITIGGSNLANVTPNGSDLLEGGSAVVPLAGGDYMTVETDGVSNWWQVG